jgi:hypothetical protein
MNTESLVDFQFNVKSMLDSALPKGVTVNNYGHTGAFDLNAGDLLLSFSMVVKPIGSYDVIKYLVEVGDNPENLEVVGEYDNISRAIVAFVIEYNKPRPTISDLVREHDEASL